MIGQRLRRNVARAATLVAAAGVVAVAAPGAAHAACVPAMDVTGYPATFQSATLNTTTGEIVYHWDGSGYASNSGCAGTMTVYQRLTDRSVAPAGPTVTSGWSVLASARNSDGSPSPYWGGGTTLSVTYRGGWTASMRGGVGQITAETRAVFVADGGPTTTWCKSSTKTFTSTPTGPQVLFEAEDTCTP